MAFSAQIGDNESEIWKLLGVTQDDLYREQLDISGNTHCYVFLLRGRLKLSTICTRNV